MLVVGLVFFWCRLKPGHSLEDEKPNMKLNQGIKTKDLFRCMCLRSDFVVDYFGTVRKSNGFQIMQSLGNLLMVWMCRRGLWRLSGVFLGPLIYEGKPAYGTKWWTHCAGFYGSHLLTEFGNFKFWKLDSTVGLHAIMTQSQWYKWNPVIGWSVWSTLHTKRLNIWS